MDLEKREALLYREDVSYFTATRDHTRVTILGQHTQANVQLGELTLPVVTGAVRVVKQVGLHTNPSRYSQWRWSCLILPTSGRCTVTR